MIREATLDDLEALLRMGMDFHEAAGFKKYVDLDLESIADVSIEMMDSDKAILLVAEQEEVVGFGSVLIYPFWMNNQHLVGQQLAIWVDPDQRDTGVGIQLIRGMESAAKDKGAEFFLSIAFNAMGDNTRKLFKSLGYKALEQAFIRRL